MVMLTQRLINRRTAKTGLGIARILRRWIDADKPRARVIRVLQMAGVELAEVKPLEGGVINTTLCLTLQDSQRAVLKISPHRVNRDYEREAHQLQLLQSIGIPAPRVYAMKTGSLDDPHSYVLMEFMEGIDLAEAKRACAPEQFDRLQQDLADTVLRMHANTSPTYCRVRQSEDTPKFQSWPEFFRHVYDPIVREAEKNAEIAPKSRKLIAKIHEKLDRLLVHEDVPRLVHWDIWSTNLLAKCDEKGNWRISAVLDPNCKYAHAEAEIAYLDLFHTSTPTFMKAYQSGQKLDETYHRVRKPIYQLYPMIDHVNLFGHDYVKPMMACLERAAELV
jgi:fructosamine-3-kinase